MSKSASPLSLTIAAVLESRIADSFSVDEVPLRQAELAAEFGTSHIPVREALSSLAQAGIVRIAPNRGAVIPPLAVAQNRELALMRCELEALAVRQAVPNLNADQRKRAAAAARRGRAARSLKLRSEQNWAFHRALYEAADMPFLLEQMERLWRHADRYLRFAWSQAGYQARSDDDHEAILRAFEAGAAERAEQLTREHIVDAAREIDRLLGALQPG